MDGQILELGFQQWYREGREAGFEEGREEGRKSELSNTLREKSRADTAEARVKQLEADAQKQLAQIKELEAKVAEKNNS